jgi:hypothetical protein
MGHGALVLSLKQAWSGPLAAALELVERAEDLFMRPRYWFRFGFDHTARANSPTLDFFRVSVIQS